VEALRSRGGVVYHEGVRVHHRRRAFPGPYLRQRWRYRVKTGRLQRTRRDPKVTAFVVAGAIGILLAPLAVVPYALATLILGARTTRLPMRWWPVLPIAFAMHHLTYWLGIVTGLTSPER
jgi:hypothetical protein